jgi:hypothetical protein
MREHTINTEAAIAKVRSRIHALHTERRALEGQPRSRQEVAERVRCAVSRWRDEARKDMELALREIASGGFGAMLMAQVIPARYGSSDALLGPVLALVLGDTLTNAMLQHLEAVPEGMEAADRTARLTEISEELDALETEEEALICQGEDRGDFVLRRGDARPEIVLGTLDPVLPRHVEDEEVCPRGPRFVPFIPPTRL